MAGHQAGGMSVGILKAVEKMAGARMGRRAWGPSAVGTKSQPVFRWAVGLRKRRGDSKQ